MRGKIIIVTAFAALLALGLVAPLSVTEEITVTSPTAQEIQALRESLLPR